MKRRGVIRRVVLPAIWVVIGALIAASLVKLAFLGGSASARSDDPLTPTGEVPAEVVAVERGDVSNKLTIEGTIELDPARSALAASEGELSYIYVGEGFRAEKGEPLFQIRTEKEATFEEVPEGRRRGRNPAPVAPPAPSYTYTTVVAPVTGRVSPYAVSVGDPVGKGTAVVSVQPSTYKAVGSITPLDRYRLLDKPFQARVTIKGGPRPFACRHLTVGDAAAPTAPANPEEGGMGEGMAGGESATSVTCRVPDRVVVFDGLTMSMAIPAGSAKGVLVVPVTAVRGLLARGKVWVVGPEGAPKPRNVELGITDGKQIEVLSASPRATRCCATSRDPRRRTAWRAT
jgi:multidrug efflux pump subunit AcrA (membrane-fusion protein)